MAKAKQTEASVYLYGPIGPYSDWGEISASDVAEALDKVGSAGTLNVYLNSPGGAVDEGLAIYANIKRFKAKKVIWVDGLAASIASIVAMAGDEINMAFNSRMMIHDPWWVCVGNARDMRATADLLDKRRDDLLGTYVAKTKGDRNTIASWMEAETWFSADEAVRHGFASRKVDGDGEVQMDDRSKVLLAKYRHTPKDLIPSAESLRRAQCASQQIITNGFRRTNQGK